MNTIYAPWPLPAQNSLWLNSAVPAPVTPPIARGGDADIVIVGAGYTGLSAALSLAERGREAVVLDAGDPGYGASGRNGGQVIPGLKYDPEQLLELFGHERGKRMAHHVAAVAEQTFDLIERYGLDCEARRCGWIQAASSPRRLEVLHERARQWRDGFGVPARDLDAAEIERLTGAHGYCGGWLDPRGGTLHPLSYVRELARVAIAAGARVHGGSLVTALRAEGGAWRVSVNGVELRARAVVLATNGYTGDLWPGLRRTILPATSIQLATEPLPVPLREHVLPGGIPVSDSRRLLVYMRLSPDGRLVVGGRGSFSQREPQRYYERLRETALRMYPQLAGVRWEFQWGGLVDLTVDGLPHLHHLAPGLVSVLGYNGRGVALASQMGRTLADLLCEGDDDATWLPVSRPREVPLHGLRRPFMEMAGMCYGVLDRLGL